MQMFQFLKSFLSNIIVRNLLLLGVLIALMVGGLLYWLEGYTHHNQAIIVPDVNGMQVAAAAPLLQDQQLRYMVIDSINSRTAAPGAIVDQVPKAQSKVKQNRIVFLTINARSAQMVVLPDVLELSQRQALAKLRALGFKVEKVEYVPYKYKDLVLNVLYKNKTVNAQTRLPYGTSLMLKVGDGYEQAQSQDSIQYQQDSAIGIRDAEYESEQNVEVESNGWFD